MGIFSDLLSGAQGIDNTLPITALDKGIKREIDEWITRGDAEYPVAGTAIDEVQVITQFASDPSGGDFTLTFTLRSGETFTTAAIAYNAVAATIETAIDVAATAASIVGWTNGDITVAGTTLLAAGGDITLTFDGASVALLSHGQTTIDGTGLTGGGLGVPPESTTTEGQTNRAAWSCLAAMGVVADADFPVQGVLATAFVPPSNPGDNPYYPSQATLRALAAEAAIDDQVAGTEAVILASAGLV